MTDPRASTGAARPGVQELFTGSTLLAELRAAALDLAHAAAGARRPGDRGSAERDVLARALAWSLLARLAELERTGQAPSFDPATRTLRDRLDALCRSSPELAAGAARLAAALASCERLADAA